MKKQCDECEYRPVCFPALLWKQLLMNTICGQGRKAKVYKKVEKP